MATTSGVVRLLYGANCGWKNTLSLLREAPRSAEDTDKEISPSLKKDQLKPIQDAQIAPDAVNIAALIKEQGHYIGDVTVSDLQRPEMGGSAGSLGFQASVNEGKGYEIKDFFIRFESMGEKAFKNYDLAGQFRTHQILAGTIVPVPPVLYLDPDGSTLGTPGFIMEKLEGEVPSDVYQTGVLGEASSEEQRKMVFGVVETLANIHSLDWKALGFEFLQPEDLRGETWVDHELNRIWENICWGCPERIPRAEPIYRWLLDNQPRDEEIVLNHGDANYTNFMFRDNNLIAALDWEFACLGPKEFDLAFVLVVTGVLTIGQTAPPGFPTPEEIKAEYQRLSGYQLRYWEYYCKKAYFSVAQRLWMGIRFFPPEKRIELDVRPNYCIDRILGGEPIEI